MLSQLLQRRSDIAVRVEMGSLSADRAVEVVVGFGEALKLKFCGNSVRIRLWQILSDSPNTYRSRCKLMILCQESLESSIGDGRLQ